MNRLVVLILCSAWSLSFAQAGPEDEKDCDAVLKPESAMDLTVSVLRNSSGEWIALFSAERALSVSDKGMNVRIKHAVFKSRQTNIVRVSGIIRDAHFENPVDVVTPGRSEKGGNDSSCNVSASGSRKEEHPSVLRFHEKTAKNIVLINKRRTAYRNDPMKNDVYGGLFTDRPLMDDELFQVQIDQVINKWTSYSVYMGVTRQTPHDIENQQFLSNGRNGTWSMWASGVEMDGKTINGSYPLNLRNLSVGTRIGVRRKKNGDLHFYLDGVDKGLAAKNLPGPVYGIFDLVNYASQVSLVD